MSPDKLKYLHTLITRQTYRIEPDCIYVVNQPDSEMIFPAKKVGMKTVWIKQGFGKYWQVRGDDEQADYVVADLNELIHIFGYSSVQSGGE